MTQPPAQPTNEQSWSDAMAYPLATIGALLGALVGAGLHKVAYHSGFYAIILVGLGAGFGPLLFTRKKSIPIGIIAAFLSIVVAVFAEWWAAPFTADDSFSYFLAHIPNMAPFRLLLHALNPFIAFYIGSRR